MLTEGTHSTPPCPSYSPSQRSRYSQPSLPNLQLISSPSERRAIGCSPDRRIRMSQPVLNTSSSGYCSLTSGTTSKARLSYSSLRCTSGDSGTTIGLRVQEKRLSTPNVHTTTDLPSSQPNVAPTLRRNVLGKRERLSQPTLITGDYCPAIRAHQRLSQPCLITTEKELFSLALRSPVKHNKRFGPPAVKLTTQRDRLSQLDIGARYRNLRKDPETSTSKFNRDRFSIPELQTSNDLRLIVGTPKQRFSLDSSLGEPGRSRLLPIASSPISENNSSARSDCPQDNSSAARGKNHPADGLESVLITSTTPILANPTIAFPTTTRTTTSALTSTVGLAGASTRERLSVPEIRSSSLRRLLDSPVKQRHSLTGNLRQCLLSAGKGHDLGGRVKRSSKSSICKDVVDVLSSKDDGNNNGDNGKEEPRHVQRHYAYTYDTKEETTLIRRKLNVRSLPRKKYLESNFDRNEQVITTVIETEVPMILSSPKYTKGTHAYSSETPRWMRKYLENESPKIVRETTNDKNDTKNNYYRRNDWINSNRGSFDESVDCDSRTPARDKSQSCSNDDSIESALTSKDTGIRKGSKDNTGDSVYAKMKNSSHAMKNAYDVSVDSSWTEADICRLYGLECDDTDTDESTSV